MASPGRPPLDPRITALELQCEDQEKRIQLLEQRIATLNEYFARGYLPPNVQPLNG